MALFRDILFRGRVLYARELLSQPSAAVSFLRAEQATRVFVFDYLLSLVGRQYLRREPVLPSPPSMPAVLRRSLARRDGLTPPVGEIWGLFGSSEFDFLVLQPRPLRNLTLVFRASEETPDFLRLLRTASVSHAVALHVAGLSDLIHVATLPSPIVGDVHVFRVPGPLPRAYVVGRDAPVLQADVAFRAVPVPAGVISSSCAIARAR